ncbi:exonuclease domain-containing protein [Stackebrandtia nassauensis]|uniref:Exonuclease RNase T and DNA polymerase III n=1 Tax=Stackebrandtia nassauensis (strain DSM 44728 / CIP 108903 / NRRL B-16338 / NBRC 102104 / LLR-40K-21) TaxID=446470 RepID=D3Q9D6_STANL|nr:exonuclease domain-containing protein [Stackebrandtia nassauensis]ADD42618.1 Exonuclease RNase T and DNA polymerase III [Stackebrandtia nassauensis DSM 44728]
MYAVFDTETTGIIPGMHHRIIEIAVVLADDEGSIENTWSTLLNPDRDLGPQHIHGIKARQVIDAPKFGDIAGQLIQMLSGRTLVAHNLPFDLRFLSAEFERLGHQLTYNHHLGVCTMNWSTTFLEGASRSLPECCKAAGVQLTGWHSALSDAEATAALLKHYINAARGGVPWHDRLPLSRSCTWPTVPVTNAHVRQRESVPHKPSHGDPFISALVDYLPRVQSSEVSDPYLAVLDEALSDRYLSADETAALRALATSLQISDVQTRQLHHDYLEALARVALADHHLSAEEEEDLRQVAGILDLPLEAIDLAIKAAQALSKDSDTTPLPIAPGDMVVFTGTMPESREEWEQRAIEHGFVPHRAVTKKVKLVIAADSDSLSGKAKKARGYNIPIMDVDRFREVLGYPAPAAW